MQQNFNYPPINNMYYPQALTPNAVNINIVAPQAYSGGPFNTTANPNFYSMYGQNPIPGTGYPMNYNMANASVQQGLNALGDTNLKEKTANPEENSKKTDKKDKKDEKEKLKTVLTDDYIKSLENYLNNDNPKIRLIGAKELLERFKEDSNRKDNPSLVPLLNKTLRDTSPSVRFLGLTMLQTGYSVGNEETVEILKEIQASNKDGLGDDALAASEVLLKMSLEKAEETK